MLLAIQHIIMKQIFENIGANIIGDVRGEGYLEGGDFFVAREDLSMLGVGLRTDMNGAKYLMKNDLLGTRYMGICLDENDLDQQRMHLDTYFNILNDNNVLVIDFEDVKNKNFQKILDIWYKKDKSYPYTFGSIEEVLYKK